MVMIASSSVGSISRTSMDTASSVASSRSDVERVSPPLPWATMADRADDRDQRIMALVRAQGGRVTPAKRAVVGVLARSEDHLTAEDLISRVTAASPATAASTIYRVLQQLEEIGAVEHVHP